MIAPAYSNIDLHGEPLLPTHMIRLVPVLQSKNPHIDIFKINEQGLDRISDNYQEGMHFGQQCLQSGGDVCEASVAV